MYNRKKLYIDIVKLCFMLDIKRVIKVVDWLIFEKIVTSRKDLALKMGYTESSMSQILNQKVPLSERFIKKLSILDERIDFNWILDGEGDMLKTESTTDSSNMLPSISKERLIELGAEAFEKKLLDMFQKGEIYSAATVKEKDLLIHELLIKVGKLEAKVEELEKEKGNVRTDENVTCANVG